jgi:GntR family transcriptional repressor for pyruvate dehydrogenase complex
MNEILRGARGKVAVKLPEFRRQNLVHMVFDALKENILSAKLAEGERLPSIDALARQVNVSRTVIREALHKLSSLGMIRSHQGRGTFVCRPDPGAVMEPMLQLLKMEALPARDLLETRYHLERIIARLAARRARTDQVASLHDLIETMQRAIERQDLDLLSKEDMKFHLALAEVSGNPLLSLILENIREMTFKFMYAISHIESVRLQALASHRRIVEAVAKNDPALADQEMAQHILNMVEAIRVKYQIDIALE